MAVNIVSAVCFNRSAADNVYILRLADLYFTHAVSEGIEKILDLEVLLEIFPTLQENLSSPQSQVRMVKKMENFMISDINLL